MSDGAGAVIIASEDAVKKHNFTPLARIVGYHVSGCDPSIMGIGEFIMKTVLLTRVGSFWAFRVLEKQPNQDPWWTHLDHLYEELSST